MSYSQARYHESYRTDCSGFVSMCWALTTSDGEALSLSTRTLPTTPGIASAIATASLLPGDIEVAPGHHTFLFVAWGDLAHSTMISIEEAGTQWGTISRVRQTSLLAGYRAYRRKGIESDPAYAARLEMIERTAKLPSLPDRFSSSVRASMWTFPSTRPPSLVIASADDWKTAVTAPAMAGRVSGPLLLVTKDSVPSVVAAEIRRLRPAKAYLVGPSSVITTKTMNAVISLGLRVERISGVDAVRNSITVMNRQVQLAGKNKAGQRLWDGTVLLANAADRADMESAASLSARKRWPLLLTSGATLSPYTRGAIERIKPTTVVVLGGPGVLSDAVLAPVRKRVRTVYRLAGVTRYDTAIKIADKMVATGATWNGAGLVPEGDLVDSLAGSVAQAHRGSFTLATPRRSLSKRIGGALGAHRSKVGKVRIFGSESALDYRVRDAVWDILHGSP